MRKQTRRRTKVNKARGKRASVEEIDKASQRFKDEDEQSEVQTDK